MFRWTVSGFSHTKKACTSFCFISICRAWKATCIFELLKQNSAFGHSFDAITCIVLNRAWHPQCWSTLYFMPLFQSDTASSFSVPAPKMCRLSLANCSQHMHSFLPNFVIWYFPKRYLLWLPQCAFYNLDSFYCCPSGSILKLRGSQPTLGPFLHLHQMSRQRGGIQHALPDPYPCTGEEQTCLSLYTRL